GLGDVARDDAAEPGGALEKVGMVGVEVPLRLRDEFGRTLLVPAKADLFVSLDDPAAKGIHMSRLFLALQAGLETEDFRFPLVEKLLHGFVASQAETSRSAHLKLSFDYMASRRSLLSENFGWRTYPASVSGSLVGDAVRFQLDVRITYSSTCPCSAALARHAIQDRFAQDFGGRASVDAAEMHRWLGQSESICATPHSQRSHADISAQFASTADMPTLASFLGALEEAIGTPVQTAVKREDEQEFARLNGANLMFAEDAARKFKTALEAFPGVADYRIAVNHLESLHPHDAVAIAVKGVPGGLEA
ncbi:MAG TPA: GTP cyclohydrolase FolE2, partial [Planctomycetia bacterium]|nr:GTP cyclohydrolase FolE2 [Planctomycetia bacterium]